MGEWGGGEEKGTSWMSEGVGHRTAGTASLWLSTGAELSAFTSSVGTTAVSATTSGSSVAVLVTSSFCSAGSVTAGFARGSERPLAGCAFFGLK